VSAKEFKEGHKHSVHCTCPKKRRKRKREESAVFSVILSPMFY
jgi:hypothetical protein